MKQLMKLVAMLTMVVMATSCTKENDELGMVQPSNRASNTSNVVDSMDYTLDFRCDTLGLNVSYCHAWKVLNFMYGQMPTPNLVIGKTFRFTDAVSGAEFTIVYQWDGVRFVGDVTGRYLGHTFTDLTTQGNGNGAINMCGWYQGAKYKFRLRNSRGEVVFTNWGSALSKQ
jgi:hypothetical protein